MATSIPGSEKFASHGAPVRRERVDLHDGRRLHALPADAKERLDPLTFEVIRHRLAAITTEMGNALRRMSGSLIVSEINDFNISLHDEVGSTVQFGLYNVQLSVSGDLAIRWVLEHRADNPGIHPGDMFLTTDPWVGGGVHQNDVCLVAPIFIGDVLFGWAVSIAHQVDVGGVAPGSWSTQGRDVFWESLPLPPIKVVESGVLREDVEDSYVRRSRVPALVALDLRAKIGANNVAIERITELVKKYGIDTVKAVMARIMDDSETRLRTRLRELPDGEWQGVSYQDSAREGDRGIYKVTCTLRKTADSLEFDYSGTDPQVEGFINCTYGGLRSGVVSALLPTLCSDMPWSGGLWRVVSIKSQPGAMNDAEFPAGVGKASVASAWATQNAALECLSALLDMAGAPEDLRTACATPCGAWDLVVLSGRDQRNAPFVAMLGDPMAGGGAACADHDGGDMAGLFGIPMGRIADVEMNEFQYPLLYLWRRQLRDSGGPGRFRGGVGGSACIVLHNCPDPELDLVVSQAGKALPQASGLSGGLSGSTGYDVVVRGAGVAGFLKAQGIPGTLASLPEGSFEELPVHLTTRLGIDDVYCFEWQGGGGYGDPLQRDAQEVAEDVRAGLVSEGAAESMYGVILAAAASVDVDATKRRRDDLLLGRATETVARSDHAARPSIRLGGNLLLDAEGDVHCANCGARVGDRDGFLGAATRLVAGREAGGPQVRGTAAITSDVVTVFRNYVCPGCGISLHSEVVPERDALLRARSRSVK